MSPSQSTSPTLEALRQQGVVWRGTSGAGLRVVATGLSALDAQLPGGGWPAGALSELLVAAHGIGELSLALPLAARVTQAGQLAAFVAPPLLPYAPALAQAGLVLSRTLIVEPRAGKQAADEAIWAAEQLLRSPACGLVLLWTAALREADARRLQLAAEQADTPALVYRPAQTARNTSIAALRLMLTPAEPASSQELHIEILKARGGRAGARFVFNPQPDPQPGPQPSPQPGPGPDSLAGAA